MASIVASMAVVPLGLLFLLSGLFVNFIQAACFIAICPYSKSLYRRINRVVAELLWLQLVWLVDWWAGVKVKLYADSEAFQLMGKGHALVICNHRSDIDWLVGWILAQSGLQQLKDFPQPFWLALFVEGTCFTHAKLLAAQEYAASQGLPILRYVLIPRTKVHVHMKRHAMNELPQTDDAVAQWCKEIFVAKDSLLDKHLVGGTFGDEEYKPIGRPKKSLLVIISWSCLLLFAAFRFIKWSSLLSTTRGILFSALGLLVVTFVMHIFIVFSQSERSTPAKVAPTSQKRE